MDKAIIKEFKSMTGVLETIIIFPDGKPNTHTLAVLKSIGFHYSPRLKEWRGVFWQPKNERAFRKLVVQEDGNPFPPGPWDDDCQECGAKEGLTRCMGIGVRVLCDKCFPAWKAEREKHLVSF